MHHSYPASHGLSRPSSRRSPTILNPTQFSAGATQTEGWPYDPTRSSTTTVTPNGQYQSSTMQAGYSYPLQAAGSSYHTQTVEYANYTQTVIPSSRYQNCNVYPNEAQLYQQIGTSYQSASGGRSQQAYYDPSVQSSLNSTSTHQYAAAIASTSASQSERSEASKPTVSTSRPRNRINPDMKSKMNRFRATDMASTIPVESPLTYKPMPSAAGEKRKERSPTPDSIRAGAPPEKEAKRKEAGRARAQNARDKLNSDVAKLAGKLPSHLRAPGNMSSKENIVKAAAYIDEQHAEIKRLKDEAAQLKLSQANYQQQVYQHGGENFELLRHLRALDDDLGAKNARIGELEWELQTCQQLHPRHT